MQSGSFSNACRDPSGNKWGTERTRSLWLEQGEQAGSTANDRAQKGGRRLETRKKWEGGRGRRWNGEKGGHVWCTQKNWERWKVWEGLARADGSRKGSGRQRENQSSPTRAPIPQKSEGRCSVPPGPSHPGTVPPACTVRCPQRRYTPVHHLVVLLPVRLEQKKIWTCKRKQWGPLGCLNSPTEEIAVSSGNLFPSRRANGIKRSALTRVHLEWKRDLGRHSALSCNDTGTM